MRLVDTNIIFSLLVYDTPWHELVRRLHAMDDDWRTESHALVEISNVLSRYARVGSLDEADAVSVMVEADERMRPAMLVVDHALALRTAMDYKVSAYDARFLACAAELGCKLVTEDAKLRRAAPALTQSVEEALEQV